MATTDQDHFFQLLDNCPRISGLWDRNRKKMNIEQFEKELKVMSSGEIHLAKFFAGIWLNHNKYGFDIIASMHVLDTNSKRLISSWIESPFFP